MKVNELTTPSTKQPMKEKIRYKLREILSMVEEFENSKEIKKDEIDQMDTLKKFASHMVKDDEKIN